MRTTLLVLVLFILCGCASQALTPVPVKVAGQIKTYVVGKQKVGMLGDEITTIDRYDEKGNLVHASDISTTGTVHDTLKSAAGSTGTAAMVTPVMAPVINAIEGK